LIIVYIDYCVDSNVIVMSSVSHALVDNIKI
jgi:hypothetical protein